jgi:molybdenum cofactor cytidylyltransferase
VVLAAGRGSRYDQSRPGAKLLAHFRGRPLVAHVLDAAVAARGTGVLAEVVVVVPPDDERVTTLANAVGVRTVVNRVPELGLSSSLRRGLAALDSTVGAALLCMGDQPLVRPEVIASLAAAWHTGRHRLVRPRYAEAPEALGHPVLVDRFIWRLAQRLEGDAGFGSLLGPGSAGVLVLDVPGGNPDVDTAADLHTLEGSSS